MVCGEVLQREFVSPCEESSRRALLNADNDKRFHEMFLPCVVFLRLGAFTSPATSVKLFVKSVVFFFQFEDLFSDPIYAFLCVGRAFF